MAKRDPTPTRLAALSAAANFPRQLLLTYLPLSALDLLGGAQPVSVLFLVCSVGGLLVCFGMPALLSHTPRIVSFHIVAAGTALSLLSLALGSVPYFIAGLFLFLTCAAANEILQNLFAMENLPRSMQGRYETLRMTFTAVGNVLGPISGVLIAESIGPQMVYAVAAAAVPISAALAQATRLKARPKKSNRAAVNPLAYLRRFVSQPRLNLAYLLSAGRAAWWQMYFTYCPIMIVELGVTPTTTALFISGTQAFLFLTPFWSLIAHRIGVRRLVIGGFAGGAASIVMCFFVSGLIAKLSFVVLAAAAINSLDGVGNVYFLRAVHPFERAEMATVFSSYRNTAQIFPSAVFSVLLRSFDLAALVAWSGVYLFGLAMLGRRLPKSM